MKYYIPVSHFQEVIGKHIEKKYNECKTYEVLGSVYV